MPIHSRLACFCALILLGFSAHAAPASFALSVDALTPNQPISAPQALCVPTADGKSDKIEDVIRPTIRWSGAPKDTKSFAIFMMDPDVPADFTDAGKEGKIIAADDARQDFFHWGVVDIAADVDVIQGGLAKLPLASGRELPNDLGAAGYVPTPGQYGGPCPPWNDARIHHYHFIVLALSDNVTVGKDETAKTVFARLIVSPMVLGKATVVGTYTLNQKLRAEGK